MVLIHFFLALFKSKFLVPFKSGDNKKIGFSVANTVITNKQLMNPTKFQQGFLCRDVSSCGISLFVLVFTLHCGC